MDVRRENQTGQLKFYHLHWPREEQFFQQGPKVLGVRKCEHPIFVYVESEAYVMMAINVIKSIRIDLKYLTAILNSKIVAFWLRHKGKMQGYQFQIDKAPLLTIPIVLTNTTKQMPIIKLVESILTSKLAHPGADTTALEREIDQLVYKLYGLTPEEIKLVEGTAK